MELLRQLQDSGWVREQMLGGGRLGERADWGAQKPLALSIPCRSLDLLPCPPLFRGFYDRKKLFWKTIEDVTLVAACGPPGGGRQGVTPRLLRHFTLLSMPAPSEVAMRTIFGAILGGFLATFFPPGEGGGAGAATCGS